MFRLSYIEENEIRHKSFPDTKLLHEWAKEQKNIIPLKILVWDEYLGCYSVLKLWEE